MKSPVTRKWHVTNDQSEEEKHCYYMRKFLQHLRTLNYSSVTIEGYQKYLGYFQYWCLERNVLNPIEVDIDILEQFRKHLSYSKTKTGKILSASGQYSHIAPVKSFFRFLLKQRFIFHNPAEFVEFPKKPKQLPRTIITFEEFEKIVNCLDPNHRLYLRDRAILETLYATGIRRGEIRRLKPQDINFDKKILHIKQAKGDKDRFVPISSRALKWINEYSDKFRSIYVLEPDDLPLFLGYSGEPLTEQRLTQMIRKFINIADINKKGSCHVFRHSVATSMLDAGADIRYIQALLGHSKLESTQVYTQVSLKRLREVYDLTHPTEVNSQD